MQYFLFPSLLLLSSLLPQVTWWVTYFLTLILFTEHIETYTAILSLFYKHGLLDVFLAFCFTRRNPFKSPSRIPIHPLSWQHNSTVGWFHSSHSMASLLSAIHFIPIFAMTCGHMYHYTCTLMYRCFYFSETDSQKIAEWKGTCIFNVNRYCQIAFQKGYYNNSQKWHYNSINVKLEIFWNKMQSSHDFLENT